MTMKSIKMRFVSMVMAGVMAVTMVAPAMAVAPVDQTNGNEQLIEALNFVEVQKDTFGLGEVEFSDLEIGDIIHSYEYADGEVRELTGMYPLFYNDEMVALALPTENGGYQIMTALTDEITASGDSDVAFVYDRYGCNLYNGNDFTLIAESPEETESRSALPSAYNLLDAESTETAGSANVFDEIVLTDLSVSEPVGYQAYNRNARVQTHYSCNIKYVSQKPYQYICWAACIASISNCLKNTNYTAEEVAKCCKKDEPSGFNQPSSMYFVVSYMNNSKLPYQLGYRQIETDKLHLRITDSIMSRMPVCGLFSYSSGTKHYSVIYALDIMSGYFSVMDPGVGMISTYGAGDGTYTYTQPTTHNTLTLYQASASKTVWGE